MFWGGTWYLIKGGELSSLVVQSNINQQIKNEQVLLRYTHIEKKTLVIDDKGCQKMYNPKKSIVGK